MEHLRAYLLVAVAFAFPGQSHARGAIETTGDVLSLMPAYVMVSSLLLEDEGGCVQLGIAALTTFSVTTALKYAVGKPRPTQMPWERGTSFPSGHTSSAFVGAAYVHRRYGILPSLPVYAASAFVAYSRVYAKKHYWVDVVAGAALGMFLGHLFARPYEPPFSLVVGADTKSVTASIHLRF